LIYFTEKNQVSRTASSIPVQAASAWCYPHTLPQYLRQCVRLDLL
jgi:hypothetical protein